MKRHTADRYTITEVASRIFLVKPAVGSEITVNDVWAMRKVYLEFSNDGPFAILLDATEDFIINDAARALIASKEFTEKRKAAAFVTPGLVNRLVGNFFIQFNKPASPTRLFNDEAGALEWLKGQMKEY